MMQGRNMIRQHTTALVHELAEAYRKGDEELLSNMIHDDIDWEIHGPEYLLFVGQLRGKRAVLKMLTEAANLYTLTKHDVLVRIIEGNRAALMSQVAYEQRSTKRTITSRRATFLRFQQNLLLEFRMFIDTFDLVEQVHGTWIDIPVVHTVGWKQDDKEA
jgi:ketosteroid isomerase-like protein